MFNAPANQPRLNFDIARYVTDGCGWVVTTVSGKTHAFYYRNIAEAAYRLWGQF